MTLQSLIPALALAAAAAPASAHIVLSETQATAGGYYVAAFRVGHGCDGKPTTALSVTLPDGVTEARTQPKAGWGVRNTGSVVRWSGRLEEDQFEVFSLLVRLPNRPGPLYFPTVQTCGDVEQRWVEIPEPGQPWNSKTHPAPVVTLAGPGAAAPPAASGVMQHQH